MNVLVRKRLMTQHITRGARKLTQLITVIVLGASNSTANYIIITIIIKELMTFLKYYALNILLIILYNE